MQRFKTTAAFGTVLAAFGTAIGISMTTSRADPKGTREAPAKGVAVVELFTSEGCSSCPPAEAALAELIAKSKGRPVYALAFHVDYFDGLGWADPFASRTFTDRQVKYAGVLKGNEVYTPQVVVNGSVDVLGSDRATLQAAVADAIAQPVTATLAGTVTRVGESLRVAVTTAGLPAGAIVNAALVEDQLTSDVRRGENGGRRLVHDRVVRALRSGEADAHGNVTLDLPVPEGVRRDRAAIVLLGQSAADLHVLGAAEVRLPK